MQPLSPNPVSSAYLSLEGTVTQYLSAIIFAHRSLSLSAREDVLPEHAENACRFQVSIRDEFRARCD